MGRSKKNISLKEKLNVEERVKLAGLVRNSTCLWKLSDCNYRKQDAATAAWIRISEEMGTAVSTCKESWKTLKDGLRYQLTTKAKAKKSGDPLEDVTGDPDNSNDEFDESYDDDKLKLWKFWEAMRFLIEERPKRKTLCSLDVNNIVNIENSDEVQTDYEMLPPGSFFDLSEIPHDVLEEINLDEVNEATQDQGLSRASKRKLDNEKPGSSGQVKSQYSYQHKKIKKVDSTHSEDKIAESIQALVEIRKKEAEDGSNGGLKYYSMYVNLDRMLQTLPESTVEELNFFFICKIRDVMNSGVYSV